MSRRILNFLRPYQSAADPASGAGQGQGDIFFNTASNSLRTWNGSIWQDTWTVQRIDFSFSGTLATGVILPRAYIEWQYTFVNFIISVNTPSAGAAISIDLLRGNGNTAGPGTSIYTTKPSLAAGAYLTNAATPTTTSYSQNDYFQVQIISVGTTTAGADFNGTLILRRS